MLTKRAFVSTATTAGAVAAFGFAGFSRALADDDYPSRAIHFILPFPAGPTDLVTGFTRNGYRRIGMSLRSLTPGPARPARSAPSMVAEANPDGYMLLFTVDLPITMAPNLLKVPYDPQRDLIPVAAVVESEQRSGGQCLDRDQDLARTGRGGEGQARGFDLLVGGDRISGPFLR